MVPAVATEKWSMEDVKLATVKGCGPTYHDVSGGDSPRRAKARAHFSVQPNTTA